MTGLPTARIALLALAAGVTATNFLNHAQLLAGVEDRPPRASDHRGEVERATPLPGVEQHQQAVARAAVIADLHPERLEPVVGAEDVKAYFEKLRGDDEAIRRAAAGAEESGGGSTAGDGRREQKGN